MNPDKLSLGKLIKIAEIVELKICLVGYKSDKEVNPMVFENLHTFYEDDQVRHD
jgi:hypothetical protein